MPRRTFELGCYHIFNRGFEKMLLFRSEHDYDRFYLKISELLNREEFKGIKIISYAIMPNHFHLVVNLTSIPGSMSDFIGIIQESYAKYYNFRYKRRGQVYEGRFKAKLICDDDYFAKCLAYVNYNPQKHGLVENVFDWPYTSIHALINKSRSLMPLNSDLEIDFIKYKDFNDMELEI